MFELLILTTFETARIDRRELYIYRGIIRILRIPISRTITIVSPFPRKLLRPCRVPLLAPAREIIARICIYMLERLRSRPQTPSSRTISALNSANVGRFPCPPPPLPPLPCHVKPRIVCKRNDAAFAAGGIVTIDTTNCARSIEPNPLCLIHSLITLDPL